MADLATPSVRCALPRAVASADAASGTGTPLQVFVRTHLHTGLLAVDAIGTWTIAQLTARVLLQLPAAVRSQIGAADLVLSVGTTRLLGTDARACSAVPALLHGCVVHLHVHAPHPLASGLRGGSDDESDSSAAVSSSGASSSEDKKLAAKAAAAKKADARRKAAAVLAGTTPCPALVVGDKKNAYSKVFKKCCALGWVKHDAYPFTSAGSGDAESQKIILLNRAVNVATLTTELGVYADLVAFKTVNVVPKPVRVALAKQDPLKGKAGDLIQTLLMQPSVRAAKLTAEQLQLAVPAGMDDLQIYDGLLLLPSSFEAKHWPAAVVQPPVADQLCPLWIAVLSVWCDCRRVAVKAPIDPNVHSSPVARLAIHGAEAGHPARLPAANHSLVVQVPMPQGATLTVDLAQHVLNPAPFSEAERLTALVADQRLPERVFDRTSGHEVIVDLAAGLGLRLLPLLAAHKDRPGQLRVIVCDQKQACIDSFRQNATANGISESQYTAHVGSIGDLEVDNIRAHRVIVGLPLGASAYSCALRALHPHGGILHVHFKKAHAQQKQQQLAETLIINLRHELDELMDRNDGRRKWAIEVLGMPIMSHSGSLIIDVACMGQTPLSLLQPPQLLPLQRSSSQPHTPPSGSTVAYPQVDVHREPSRAKFDAMMSMSPVVLPALLQGTDLGSPNFDKFAAATMSLLDQRADVHLYTAANGTINYHQIDRNLASGSDRQPPASMQPPAPAAASSSSSSAPPPSASPPLPSVQCRELPFSIALGHMGQKDTHFYLRSRLPTTKDKAPSNFHRDFPELADKSGLMLPPRVGPMEDSLLRPGTDFESVLSVSSSQLHLRNCVHPEHHSLLVHVRGKKRVVLFPSGVNPSAHPDVTDVDDPSFTCAWAAIRDHASTRQVLLRQGDVLFIPAGWHHNVINTGTQAAVSVSVFWKPSVPLLPMPPTLRHHFYDFLALQGKHGLVRMLALFDAVQQCYGKQLERLRPHLLTCLEQEHPSLFEDEHCLSAPAIVNHNEPKRSTPLNVVLATLAGDHSCCQWLRTLAPVRAAVQQLRVKRLKRDCKVWPSLIEAIRQAVLDEYESKFLMSEARRRCLRVELALRKYTDECNTPSTCGAYNILKMQLRQIVAACAALEKYKPPEFDRDTAVLVELRRGLQVRMMTSWEAFLLELLGELSRCIQELLPEQLLADSWPEDSLKALVQADINSQAQRDIAAREHEKSDLLINYLMKPAELHARRRDLIIHMMSATLQACDQPLLLDSNSLADGLTRLCGLRPGNSVDDERSVAKAKTALDSEVKRLGEQKKNLEQLKQKIAALTAELEEKRAAMSTRWPSVADERSGLSFTSSESATPQVVTFILTPPAPNQTEVTGDITLVSTSLCHDLVRLFYGMRCVFAHGKADKTLNNGAMKGLENAFETDGAHDRAGAFQRPAKGQLGVRAWLEDLTRGLFESQSRYPLTHNVLINMHRLLCACGELAVQQASRACQAAFNLLIWQETRMHGKQPAARLSAQAPRPVKHKKAPN